MPWQSGPYASALASLCTNLYPIFPAFKSGNINVLQVPATSLPFALLLAISGTIAASN